MRGRKPTPTHLRLLAGNPQHRHINQLEPLPSGALVDPPPWFSDSQKASWNYVIERAPDGLLKQLDQSVLTVWVVAEGLHRQATEALTRFGMLLRAQSGEFYPSPYVGIVNKQAAIMLKAASELGFSPAARPRIQLTPEGQGTDDFDKLIGVS
jgi:P27 family predicted phage terminase small subunit